MADQPRIDEAGENPLAELELILESDPLIDEVGFIHPTQLASLNEEGTDGPGPKNLRFWSRDRKLGISTEVILPLYREAKRAFFDAVRDYKMRCSSCSGGEDEGTGSDVMKHGKALLLVSSDFGTAWNSRRWVIKRIAGQTSSLLEIVMKESELVEKIAERSKMNYRAWNHRCWLVSYMTREQVLDELKKSKTWTGLHVADSSSFNYRRRLLTGILEDLCCKEGVASLDCSFEVRHCWKDELDWDEILIKRYVGREALWLYRRFLSLCWIRHFTTHAHSTSCNSNYIAEQTTDPSFFLDKELDLVSSCLAVQDDHFDDFQAQALYSSSYILWLAKQMPSPLEIELRQKLTARNMNDLLSEFCPNSSFLCGSSAEDAEGTQAAQGQL
ncbi:uncharacterized protein LOC115725991 isoform X2 [Rhodamnia argentea]|uniref:Uncharacterized protein LOC115725991 isoform X2 n=1 Tax=Rhodamnia argentea TaxID=178133 RepID=A0ABM3HE62_9MYRT|nr:uncharacterized protein LOC115725991 isoform X2 [Rhodamnia argentea]